MNYYAHHIGDFIRDTARLSDSQCMAYLRLIWIYYETEEPIDSDVDAVAFKIGANASDVHQILKHFFFLHEGKWHNSRCDKEILAFREKSSKAKKSANARWSNADAMRTHSERSADATVSDANQEPITNISTTSVVDKKPPKKGAKPSQPMAKVEDLLQAGFSLETASEFISYKSINKAPLTIRAWRDHLSESEKAGWTPLEAAEKVMAKSWKGFEAKYVANERPVQQERQSKTFRERDAEAGMIRWEELTGQRHPDRDRVTGHVIDASPVRLQFLETSQ